MASRRYARTDDDGAAPPPPPPPQTAAAHDGDDDAARKRRRSETIELVSAKLQAAAWVAAAALVFTHGGLKDVALDAARTNAPFVYLGLAASAVVGAVFCYLVLYLRYVARVELDWDVYAPRAIPTATAAGVVAFLRRVVWAAARRRLRQRRHLTVYWLVRQAR